MFTIPEMKLLSLFAGRSVIESYLLIFIAPLTVVAFRSAPSAISMEKGEECRKRPRMNGACREEGMALQRKDKF